MLENVYTILAKSFGKGNYGNFSAGCSWPQISTPSIIFRHNDQRVSYINHNSAYSTRIYCVRKPAIIPACKNVFFSLQRVFIWECRNLVPPSASQLLLKVCSFITNSAMKLLKMLMKSNSRISQTNCY